MKQPCMKTDDRWVRLAGAALRARDALRISGTELSAALSNGQIPLPLGRRLLAMMQDHAGGLQAGLKHPKPIVLRRSRADLPPWREL
jgi:hypothetical protein